MNRPGATEVPPRMLVLRRWEDWRAWLRRHVLLLALVFLLPAFFFTRWLVSTYHATEHYIAVSWYEQGEADLRAGRVDAALEDYRSALRFAHDNLDYRLRLAQTLLAAGRLDPAGADLRRIWEEEPANSVVNRELARLAVRRHEMTDAVRYYNNAIYGVWPANGDVSRRNTQIELIDYLLAAGRPADALAGLIALAADAPEDPQLRLSIGERMLRAGAEPEALRQFEEAQRLNPASGRAFALAGRSAFHLGRFADARRYLRQAQHEGDRSQETEQLLRASSLAVSLDPFAPGLSSDERVHRVRTVFDAAASAFATCVGSLAASSGALTRAAALHVRLARMAPALHAAPARHAQVQQDAMDIAFDIDAFVFSQCTSQVLAPPNVALHALARVPRKPS